MQCEVSGTLRRVLPGQEVGRSLPARGCSRGGRGQEDFLEEGTRAAQGSRQSGLDLPSYFHQHTMRPL